MPSRPHTQNKPSQHRKSPPRSPLRIENNVVKSPELGVDPELHQSTSRTTELATDQSIAARHLMYHPNQAILGVVGRCADGVNAVMDRLALTGDAGKDLEKNEILVSMCTRLMADGGTGRIMGFNDRLANLVNMQNESPRPDEYAEAIRSLAQDCRYNMTHITSSAKIPGPEGALARQGLLAFMGDLGGLEERETGFGPAYKGPLCKASLIYKAYADGLCDAQRNKLRGQKEPPSPEELEAFKKHFEAARKATSVKEGVLSAPVHTKGKKIERGAVALDVHERQGLLNTGDMAEDKLKKAYPEHEKTLADAAWPKYLVSEEMIQNVTEPVTGHVSGTFGEMATAMNLFCGTPPETVSWENPSGTPTSNASTDQVTAITALSAAGLITAGFHSAVEIFQPMSTFSTQSTLGGIGPRAVNEMTQYAADLKSFAAYLEEQGPNASLEEQGVELGGYNLDPEELKLTITQLRDKAESIEHGATKSGDMIALLQGEGGTLATLEVSRVMANHSTNPKVPRTLYSLDTRLEELGLRGFSKELEIAYDLAEAPIRNTKRLELAITAAEATADAKDIGKQALEAKIMAEKEAIKATELKEITDKLEAVADKLEAVAAKKEQLKTATIQVLERLLGPNRASQSAPTLSKSQLAKVIEEQIKEEIKEVNAAKIEASTARAEANASKSKLLEATAIYEKTFEAQINAMEAVNTASEQQLKALKEATQPLGSPIASKHRKSPPRIPLPIDGGGIVKSPELGVNPEVHPPTSRTMQLATDQSIAARHLLYYPNQATLGVVDRCADGVNAVMARLALTEEAGKDLEKNEILVSMCTRLMADGGTGRIMGFNARLESLVKMKNTIPRPDKYPEDVRSLAQDCRAKMTHITSTAKKHGPEGALARQGLLAFMGDLGGLEKKQTGFGTAYPKPLCDAELIYKTYADGVCDAQRKLRGEHKPPSEKELEDFEVKFEQARKVTSVKEGVLSAPVHTIGKKIERAATGWDVHERQGLLNAGVIAEDRLTKAYDSHQQTLLDASWPKYIVSKETIQNVTEPVTGHVSGTFGEMATAMNMFCGTPPETVSWENPSGTPTSNASKDQETAITALSAAGLITAGFHSAVEIFQPMSTFNKQSTLGSIGPRAVNEMTKYAADLRSFAAYLEEQGPNASLEEQGFELGGYNLDEEELTLTITQLRDKAESIEHGATKSVDMIALLQGEGGTLATLEVSRVMANHSADPKAPRNLYSLDTRLEELGQRGDSIELQAARKIAKLPIRNEHLLELTIMLAEVTADSRDLHKTAAEAKKVADALEAKADTAKAITAEKEQLKATATLESGRAMTKAWSKENDPKKASEARASADSAEKMRIAAFREFQVAKVSELKARAEATAAKINYEEAEAQAIAVEEEIPALKKQIQELTETTAEKADSPSVKEMMKKFKEGVKDPTSTDTPPTPGLGSQGS